MSLRSSSGSLGGRRIPYNPLVRSLKRMVPAAALALTLMLAGVHRADAHHSFAVFFNTDAQLVHLTGVVRDFQFRNPHGVITLSVGRGHDQITWRAETTSPSVLRRRGLDPSKSACGGQGHPGRLGGA